MKKLLVAAAIVLSMSACQKEDCMKKFNACLMSCQADSMKFGTLGTGNGPVTTMTLDREKREKCMGECHMDPGCLNE